MLIYDVKSRTATIGKHKGKTVYYAQAIPQGKLTSKAIEEMLSEKTTLTRGDVRHALTSLAEILQWALSEGLSVDFADLGSFKVEANSRMTLKEEDVTAQLLNKPRIRFYPRREAKRYAHSVSISVRNDKSSSASGGSSSSGTGAGTGAGGGGSL